MTATVDTDVLQAKARVLHEALPWMRRFAGRTVVVKYGGAMADHDLDASFVDDVVLLRQLGVEVVIVHGGGPEVSAAMRAAGAEPRFVDGQRVTDARALDVARMVLVGRVNKDLVGRFNASGHLAVGLSGEDGGLIRARPRLDPGGHDLGFVGDVDGVDTTVVRTLTAGGFVPVVASIAGSADGQPYNVNADAVAAALAVGLAAEKLVYLTNVAGLYENFGTAEARLLSSLDVGEVERLLAGREVEAGMVPKLTGAVHAVRAGVPRAHLLDGRLQHALLLELFTDAGVGTMISTNGTVAP